MNQQELDSYFQSLLKIADFGADISKNGLQVQNSGAPITRVGFAVDACAETIRRGAEQGCGMLFVHHGIFWGHEQTVTGIRYERLRLLIQNDMALYACHIPLDAHATLGNNAVLADNLGLQNREPFGTWRGMTIGVVGTLAAPVSVDTLLQTMFRAGEKPCTVLPFGKKMLQRIAVVSGGGEDDLEQAVACGADAFVTGEVSHESYHVAEENGITVIAGGHYQTETGGVKSVAKALAADTGIETLFIDVPTGL